MNNETTRHIQKQIDHQQIVDALANAIKEYPKTMTVWEKASRMWDDFREALAKSKVSEKPTLQTESKDKEDFLPCPFCGSNDISVYHDDGYEVGCMDCGTYVAPFFGEEADDKQKNIDFWNKRYSEPCTTTAEQNSSILEQAKWKATHPPTPDGGVNTFTGRSERNVQTALEIAQQAGDVLKDSLHSLPEEEEEPSIDWTPVFGKKEDDSVDKISLLYWKTTFKDDPFVWKLYPVLKGGFYCEHNDDFMGTESGFTCETLDDAYKAILKKIKHYRAFVQSNAESPSFETTSEDFDDPEEDEPTELEEIARFYKKLVKRFPKYFTDRVPGTAQLSTSDGTVFIPIVDSNKDYEILICDTKITSL
jgi:hypothetical protein